MDAGRLFEEHHAALFRYLVRLTGDADLAHDAAQEAFARLVSRPPRNEQPRAWLFTVATNLVRAWANKRKRRLVLLEAGAAHSAMADSAPDPEQSRMQTDQRDTVRRALEQLTEKEQVVLLMRGEGFTHREIAQAVGT